MIHDVIGTSLQLTMYDDLRNSLKDGGLLHHLEWYKEHDRLLATLQTQVPVAQNSLTAQIKALERAQVAKSGNLPSSAEYKLYYGS